MGYRNTESHRTLITTRESAMKMNYTAHERKVNFAGFLLRVAAIILCGAAMVAMLASRQHKTIEVPLLGFNDIGLVKTVDYGYSKAFVYIVIATSIAGAHALFQAASSLTSIYLGGTGGNFKGWLTLLADQIATYLLLAAAAASTEVVYVGEKGLHTSTWIAMCVIVSKFCKHVVASIIFTYLATIVFSISSIISAYQLFR